MRNHVAFKQYDPDKPAKYGMLFKSLNDERQCYTNYSLVYAGKPTKTPSPFYISGTENYVKEMVNLLWKKVPLDGRNISMDSLSTSIPITKWLLSKNITCIGPMQTRGVGIPEKRRQHATKSHSLQEYSREEAGRHEHHVVRRAKNPKCPQCSCLDNHKATAANDKGKRKEEAGHHQIE